MSSRGCLLFIENLVFLSIVESNHRMDKGSHQLVIIKMWAFVEEVGVTTQVTISGLGIVGG